MREVFSPITEMANSSSAAQLFAPVTSVALPQGLPAPILQQLMQQIAGQVQITVSPVPPVDCTLVHAIMESPRKCSRFVTRRKIFGLRQADASIGLSVADTSQRWELLDLPPKSEKSEKSEQISLPDSDKNIIDSPKDGGDAAKTAVPAPHVPLTEKPSRRRNAASKDESGST